MPYPVYGMVMDAGQIMTGLTDQVWCCFQDKDPKIFNMSQGGKKWQFLKAQV